MKKGEVNIFAIIVIIIAIILVTAIIIGIVKNNREETEEPLENVAENNVTTTQTRPTIEGNEFVNENNGLKTNTSEKLREDKTFENYKFTNIRLQTDANGSVLLADVTTTATEKLQGRDITITFVDKDGNELITINSYIGQIEPGETNSFRTETTTDITNVYDFIIK